MPERTPTGIAGAGHGEQTGVRIAGRGGQGVMLAGLLLAQAAMSDGLEVVQTQSYGPEARLGAAKSDVIISPTEIAYPEVTSPDVFLCLSHDAFTAYARDVGLEALSVIDKRATHEPIAGNAIMLPLTATARECGALIAANMVGLGAILGLTGLVSERSLREALAARVSPESLETNVRALEAGIALVQHSPHAAALRPA